MKITPYLSFDGDCAQALPFYADVFGGRVEFMQTYGESPMSDQVPGEWRGRIMHGTMVAPGLTLMAADAPPGQYAKPQGIQLSVHVDHSKEAERIFDRLAESGEATMPLEKTFWADRFGMLVDRYGIPWMVNCHQQSRDYSS
jgi:PhnB protein